MRDEEKNEFNANETGFFVNLNEQKVLALRTEKSKAVLCFIKRYNSYVVYTDN